MLTLISKDTTRAPRPGERDGKEYHFTTIDDFKRLIAEGAFIEHAQFSGNFYGTSFQTVQDVAATGKRSILDIDTQVPPIHFTFQSYLNHLQGIQQVKQTSL